MINKKNLLQKYNSKTTRLLISMYDGPEQVVKFKKMIDECNIPKDFVILRDRWYCDKIDYGVKLTNRTGTIKIGNQPDIKDYKKRKCFYTAYQMLIDWNGDVFLCPQDWQRRITMGNIMQKKLRTLAKKAEKDDFNVFMVTPDKDFAQLVSKNIFIYRPARMGNDVEIMGIKEVNEKFEIENIN